MSFKTVKPSCKLGYELAPRPGTDVCVTNLNEIQIIGIGALTSVLSLLTIMLGIIISNRWLKK
jgi:hypothetical protein